MAAITSTVLAIGGMAYKGFSAIDAAKSQSREAGRLEDQAEELERQSLADLEQNRLEAVQVPLQIFDTANELQTLDGSTILEAAAEGDQRGVQATAGKIKATQDAARTEARDTMAEVQLDLDTKTAKEGNRKGELVSGFKDKMAIEKNLEAAVMQKNADALELSGTSDLISAGTSAFSALTPAFASKESKLADTLMEGNADLSKVDALANAKTKISDAMTADSSLSKGQAYRSIKQEMNGGKTGAGNFLSGLSSFTGIGDGKDFSESKLGELAKKLGVSVKELLAKITQ